MKIAILSDIHGNTIALDAVLKDIEARGGMEEYWILGDVAALGYDPAGVIERLSALPGASFIRGNTDHYLVSGGFPRPDLAEVQNNPELIEHHLRAARSFAWTEGAVNSHGWREWLELLPVEMRHTLPDGTRVLAAHAAPGTDDGKGINPLNTDAEIDLLVKNAKADLVLVGHTHAPFDRTVSGVRVVNPGSVSNPFPPDLRACYATIEADENTYQLELIRVGYDHEAVIQAVIASHHPAAEYILGFMHGENKPGWRK